MLGYRRSDEGRQRESISVNRFVLISSLCVNLCQMICDLAVLGERHAARMYRSAKSISSCWK